MTIGDFLRRKSRDAGVRQQYSRHYLAKLDSELEPPRLPPTSPDADVLADQAELEYPHPQESLRRMGRSRLIQVLGLASLVGMIWASAELWQSRFQADAQDTLEVAAAVKTPWQSASFPVENFIAYTSPFGYRNHPYGGRRFHYGLDVAAPMGSYIRAWWEGTVVEVSDNTACGTSIVIESHGWLHIYCHMQGYVVVEKDGDRWLVDHDGGVQIRQGDLVTSGQRIGRVGMTGRTTGPHLHWGMKYRGNWVDPSVVIKAMVES